MKTSWLIKKRKKRGNSLNEKVKKTYFGKATEHEIIGSKKFWSKVNLFLLSKGFIHNNDITIKIYNKIIENESELAKAFNLHDMNIVKSTTGKHPKKLASRVNE